MERCSASTHVRCGNAQDDAPLTNLSWSDAKQFVPGSRAQHGRPIAPQRSTIEYASPWRQKQRLVGRNQFQIRILHGQCKNCNRIAAAGTDQCRHASKANSVWGCIYGWRCVDQWVGIVWHKITGSSRRPVVDGSTRGRVRLRSLMSFFGPGSWRMTRGYARSREPSIVYDTTFDNPTHGLLVSLSF